MRHWCFITELLALVCFAFANTESFNVYIPHDFPLEQAEETPQHFSQISLYKTNHKLQTFDVLLNDTFYVQLVGLQHSENYQVRICWTAADPISIEDMGYMVVPHDADFLGTVRGYARIFVYFKAKPNAYPEIDAEFVRVNVTVANIKMAIPVDLFSLVVYIVIVLGSLILLTRRFNPYQWLKEFHTHGTSPDAKHEYIYKN